MKRLAVAILLALGVAWGQAPSDPPLTKVKEKFPAPVILSAPGDGEVVWVWSRASLPTKQSYPDKANRKLLLWTPGKYFVAAVVQQQGKAPLEHHYEVEIDGPQPGPGPGPDPPPDTLETRMKKAYEADKAAGKVKESELRLVGEICKAADQFFGVVPTTGTLYQVLDLGLNTAAPGGMPQVKAVIDAHLEKVAPRAKDVPLTDALKAAMKTAFGDLARAIDACLAPQPPPGPVTGFRVIFVQERNAKHTNEQALIWNSTRIDEYLNAKAAKDGKGRPAWRRWDQDIDVSNETDDMKALWAVVKPRATALPALAISTDRGVEVVPWPATETATIELLRRYGGN